MICRQKLPFSNNLTGRLFVTLLLAIVCSQVWGKNAIGQIGWYPSPVNKDIRVFVRINKMGGFKDLYVLKAGEPVFSAKDITSFVWVGTKVVFSSSPIYGTGGIYIFDATAETITTLLKDENTEYLEISVIDEKEKRISYLYSPSVDDLAKGTKKQLRTIPLP